MRKFNAGTVKFEHFAWTSRSSGGHCIAEMFPKIFCVPKSVSQDFFFRCFFFFLWLLFSRAGPAAPEDANASEI